MDTALARALHRVVEPLHAFAYFAPEGAVAFGEAGLKGRWMAYFASRSAPMGAVPASVVTATFHNFAPALVARAIPDAWALAAPERVVAARNAVAAQGLRRLLAGAAEGPELREAVGLLRTAVEAADCAGRPLGAANQGLAWPDDPCVALWQACGVLREHRGDGHVAVLVSEDLGGREALLTMAGVTPGYGEFVRTFRGWTEEELAQTAEGLRARGLLDEAGQGTDACRELRDRLEARTDELALQPYRALGEDGAQRLLELLTPLAAAVKAG